MVNFVFHLKSNEGHIERFSFDVYMPPLPIFTKIKDPFAWHISFLVRHLRRYSVVCNCCKSHHILELYTIVYISMRCAFFFGGVLPFLVKIFHVDYLQFLIHIVHSFKVISKCRKYQVDGLYYYTQALVLLCIKK